LIAYNIDDCKALEVTFGALAELGNSRNEIDCRSRKLDLNGFSGKIVGVKIKHTRRSRGKLMVRKKVRGSEEGYDFFVFVYQPERPLGIAS
jgi:hypothetical protein